MYYLGELAEIIAYFDQRVFLFMAMVQFQSLFPAQYLCMHISGTSHNGSSRSIQVSCKSSNKWAVQEDPFRANSHLPTSKMDLRELNHFEEEIELLLQKEYAESACFLKYQSPFEVSLCFRLLRQEDLFKKFKNNDDGAFGFNLNQDVSGLIGLYEAAQLGIEGEHILDELANFLQACLAHNDSGGQARIIKETLEYPYHKTLASFKAKSFINNFKGINGWGRSTLQELAIIDYSITQETHQHELAQVSRFIYGGTVKLVAMITLA
ncbi:tricyclene synthase Oc15, chloroplastic-like [Lycium barbarum]|uniref:tricyclene synthase Oc15, chloroplastic-like n=1 Tax=Lycium barbarum TaxID=112863 RepID=UPI00293ECCA6|nr:tricyclene synthase Oc15, chloroplastic-like [Lycium barbarum]